MIADEKNTHSQENKICYYQVMDVLKEFSSVISALSALIAISFSVFVYFRTRKLLKPKERPIFSITDQKVNRKDFSIPEPQVKVDILIIFKNIGQHPAENLQIKVGKSPKDKPNNFGKIYDSTYANRIDSGGQITSKIIPSIFINQKDFSQTERKSYFCYILLTYRDSFKIKKKYQEEYWLMYEKKAQPATFMSVEQKNELEPFVSKVFPERK